MALAASEDIKLSTFKINQTIKPEKFRTGTGTDSTALKTAALDLTSR